MCVIYMLSILYLCKYIDNIYMYTQTYTSLDHKYPESVFTYDLYVLLS